ncbi:hypothetical protein Q8F55_000084 [Vanrija albida]|uniref:Uncharacterized protein n=1 Tax=Vanrija albida TaxID=181172 RepID=A0ABR3QCG8_9TREE
MRFFARPTINNYHRFGGQPDGSYDGQWAPDASFTDTGVTCTRFPTRQPEPRRPPRDRTSRLVGALLAAAPRAAADVQRAAAAGDWSGMSRAAVGLLVLYDVLKAENERTCGPATLGFEDWIYRRELDIAAFYNMEVEYYGVSLSNLRPAFPDVRRICLGALQLLYDRTDSTEEWAANLYDYTVRMSDLGEYARR